MEPIAAMSHDDGIIVVQRCTVCSHIRRNKAAPDDNWDLLLSLFGRVVPDPPAGPTAHAATPDSRRRQRARRRAQ
jgi:hypothetical protein